MKHTHKSFAVFGFAFSAVLAAEPPADVTELEALEVQASAFGGRTVDEVVQPVFVLTGEELERKRAGTVGETLSQEPGIANASFGAGVGRPVIRGLSGSRVQVLENGISALDASSISADHAVTIDPSHAQQIEIIKGPATLLFGSGAIGGVVNVVTDRLGGEPNSGTRLFADTRYGDNANETATHAGVEYNGERWSLHLDGAYRDQGDYEQGGGLGVLANSAVQTRNGSAGFGYAGDVGRFATNVSGFQTTYGLPNEPTAFIDLDQTRGDFIGQLDAPLPLLKALRARLGLNRYVHREFEDAATLGTTFDNEETELRVEAEHVPLAGFNGTFGAQIGQRDFSAIGAEAFLPSTRTETAALFWVEQRPVSFGRWEFGARVEQQRTDVKAPLASRPLAPNVEQTPISVAAGALVDLGSEYHLRLNAARAQRALAVEELYAFGPHVATGSFERSDSGFTEETSNNFEVGLDRHHGRWTWSVSAYINQIDDYVFLQAVDQGLNADGSAGAGPGANSADGDPDLVDESGTFDPVAGEFTLLDYRQANARFYGAELETDFVLLQGPFKLNLHLFGDSVRGALKSGGDLPRITPMRYGAGLEGEYAEFSAGVHLTEVERQDRISTLETATRGHTLLSADVAYILRTNALAVTLYLRGRNLLDEAVREHTSFIKDAVASPGRSLFAGVRLEF